MRLKFVVLALFMGCLVLLGPTTGLTQNPDRANRGGGMQDPGRWFDIMARGQPTLVIADQRFFQQEMQAWAQKQGISNGQLTREQYISFSQSPEMQQARERMMAQFRGRRPGNQGAAPGGPGAAPGGPAAPAPVPGGAPGGNRGGGGGDQNAWMDERFRRLDKDGDGYLSYDEMTENLKAEKDKWDTNKDGKIDLFEWREYVKAFIAQRRQEFGPAAFGGPGADSGPPADGSAEQGPKKPEPRKKVTVYRAGKLPPNIPPWFKEYDTDNDAQVALYEWKDKKRSVEDFQKYDLNGDGFITVEELIRSGAMVANKPNASTSENPPNATSSAAPGTSAGGGPGSAGSRPLGGRVFSPGGFNPGGNNGGTPVPGRGPGRRRLVVTPGGQ